jgi:hypothetical protein
MVVYINRYVEEMMASRPTEKRTDLRGEAILFKVTAREKAAIERFVQSKRKGWTVSEYIRVAVLFDMIQSGDVEALGIVSGTVRNRLVEKMRALVGQQPKLLEGESK